MAHLRFCDITREFVELDEWHRRRNKAPKSAAVISDSMEAAAHPCDGKVYDSKSAFRKVTKAHGREEMGNDKKYYFGEQS